jgi:thioredoxin 1
MRTYQTLSLLVIVGGVAFIAEMRLGESRAASPQPAPVGCDACTEQTGPATDSVAAPAPAVPTGSGRPCLVELGADDCQACREMVQVLDEVTPKLAGKVDVVRIDTNAYPQQARRWRLRMIPTQLVVGAQGEELWRHEGSIAAEGLLAEVAATLGGQK